MTVQIYIPFPGFIGTDLSDLHLSKNEQMELAEAYGERWLELNWIEGEITSPGNTLVAQVNHDQIYKLCESYIREWSVEDLRSYNEFRLQNIHSTMWLFSSQSREITLILEYMDELEDEIIEYLRANGVIGYDD